MNALRQIFALFTVKFDTKELKRGEKAVARLRGGLAKLGGTLGAVFGARALARGFNQTGEELDRIAKLSRGLGTTAESLQDIEFALDRLGGDPGSVRNMFVALNKALGDAQTGSKEYVDSFKDIGVNFRDLEGLDPVEQFNRIRDAMEQADGSARSIAGASIVLGRGFKGNLPVFKATSAEFRGLLRERRELGGFTQSQADLGEELQDVRRNFDQVNKALQGAAFAAVAPKAIEYIELLTQIIKDEQALGTANDTLGQTFAVLGGVITAALGPVAFLFFSLANLFVVVRTNWEDLGRSFTFVFDQIANKLREFEDVPILGSILGFFREQNRAGVAAQEAAGFRAPGQSSPLALAAGQPFGGLPPAQVSSQPRVEQSIFIDAGGMSSNQVNNLISQQARKGARTVQSRSE